MTSNFCKSAKLQRRQDSPHQPGSPESPSYLRPGKGWGLREMMRGYADRSGGLAVEVMEDVSLVGCGQRPGIDKASGLYIDDCDFYAEQCTPDGSELHFAGRTLYGGYFRHAWGHFLVNSTARLWPLFNGMAEAVDSIVFFRDDDTAAAPTGNFAEFFALAGIASRVKIVAATARCRFEQLIVAEPSLEGGVYISGEFMLPFEHVRSACLERHALAPEQQPLMLARSAWGRDEAQINVDRLEALFAAAGCIIVAPEQLSLSELIARMAAAPTVISFSGSAAHNFLFCKDKDLVILERCAANNIYQTAIDLLIGRPAVHVDCFWQPLLVSSTDSLTIYGLTAELRAFAADRGISLEGATMPTPLHEFRRYLRLYRRRYGYAPGLNEWEGTQLPAIAEAFYASRSRYEACLTRRVPVLWSDWFSPRVWLRMLRAWAAGCGGRDA